MKNQAVPVPKSSPSTLITDMRPSAPPRALPSFGVGACFKYLLLSFFAAGIGYSAQAATDTWSSTPTTGAWGTTANWSDVANSVPATGDSLVFGASTITSDTDNLMTPSTYSIAGITFNAGAAAYVVSSGTSGVNGFNLTGGITNNGTNLEAINDLITTTAVRTITMTAGGGNITLGGNISGAAGGFTTATSGTLTLSGNESFTGALTVGASTTVILSGSNGARPAGSNNLTVVNGTLQLQANSANTVSGTSYALSSEETANSPLSLSNGSTLQLLSDGAVTFAGGNNVGGLGSGTVTFNVNQLTAAGSNNTITFAPGGLTTFNETLNVTGGNGYTLALGAIGGDSSSLTLNPTTGNLTINGAISAVSSLTKNGAGTLTFSGSNTYTGATTLSAGTLILAANSTNTNSSSGVTSALSNSSTELLLGVNTTLALQGNTNNTIFEPSNSYGTGVGSGQLAGTNGNASTTTGVYASGNGTFNFTAGDTDGGVTTGNTLILGNFGQFGAPGATPTFNFAANNNYTLQIGSGTSGAGTLFVFNNTAINSTVAGGTLSIPGGIAINYNTTYTQTFGGAGNISVGALTIPTGGMIVVYNGTGTLSLIGANTYTGLTTISGGGTIQVGNGSTGSLHSGNALTFSGAAGAINFDEAASSSQAMGTLTVSAGDVPVESTYPGSGTTTLTFSNVAARAAGSTLNFVTNGGVNGTSNLIVLTDFGGSTTPTGALLGNGYFFDGGNYAAYSTGGYVRAFGSGDTGYVTAAGSNNIANTTTNNVGLTGNATSQASADINTLNMGAYTLALANAAAFETNGILESGNGSSTISGGASLSTTTSSGELVIRTNLSTDSLNISTPIINNGTTSLTKSGAGTLTLSGAETYTGATTVADGTLSLTGSLTGSSITTSCAGVLTESSAGVIAGSGGAFTQGSSGLSTLSGSNTYSGATTLNNGTLELVANSTNTSGGISYALGASTALTQSFGTTLTLLSNSNTIFKPSTVVYTAGGTDIYNMYVGNNGSGTGNTLILANVGQFLASSAAPVFNLSGANGYTLQLGSGTAGTGGLSIYNSTTFNSNTVGVTLSIPGGIAYDHTGGYLSTFGGVGNISVGAIVQDGSPGENLAYDGTATLTLTGANTYYGTTTVSSGTLQVGNGSTGSLYASSAVSVSGGTLAFDQANTSSVTNNIADAGTVAGIEVVGSTNTLSGTISSTGGFTQSGAGTTILSADNTYTGATNVTAGALSLTGTLGAGGGTAISNGATFTETTSGAVTGGSSVTNTAGTTTLGGINSYTGATNVSGGTLSLTGTIGAGSTGSAITNAATFNEGTAGVVTGNSSFSNTAGTANLAGVNNYSGATNVTGGTVNLTGTYSGTGATTVSGAGTLNVTGSSSSSSATYAINGGGTLVGTGYMKGAVTVAGGATLLNSSGGTLTLGNGLTLGSPISGSAILNFAEGGLNPSLIQLGSGTLTVNPGGAVLNIFSLGGIAANQAYNLIDFGAGPAAGAGSTVDGLSLGTLPSIFGVSGYSLTVSSSAVQLTTTGASAPSTAYWSGTLGSMWSANNGTTGNFTTDSAGTNFVTALPAATTNVIFSGSNASNFTNTLGQAFTISSLTFTGSNGNNAMTIAGEGNTLTVGAGGVLVQSGAGPVTLGVNLAGVGTVTDNNSAYLALLGTNSYSGGTVINSGTVRINSSSSLGTGGTAAINNGATLEALNAASSANNFTLSGNSTIQTDSGVYQIDGVVADGTSSGTLVKTGAGTLTLAAAETYSGGTVINAGTVQLGNGSTDGTLTSGVTDNAALAYDAAFTDTASYVISGSGSVTMNGSGTVILAGANSYGGATTVNAGTLQIGNGSTGSLSGSTSVTVAGGALAFDEASASSYSGNIANTGTVVGAEGAGITNTLGGVISGVGGAFTQSGAGTTILSGANSYTGATTVSGGTLSLTGSLAGSSVSTSGAGVFTESSTGAISGASATITQGSTGTSTLSGSNTYSGATTLSGGTLVLVANSGNTSASGTSSALSNSSSELLLGANTTLELLGNTNNTIFEPGTAAANSNTAGINESGNGAYNFTAGNNGSGTGNTLILGNFGQFADGSGSTFNFAVNNNYTLEIGSGSAGTGALYFSNNPTINSTVAGGTLSIPGGMFVDAPHSYTVTFGGAGNISIGALNNQGGAALAVTSTSTGTVTLIGANGYTGATTVSAGTLQVGNGSAGSLNASSIPSVSSGATLAFDEANGGSQTQNISDAGTVAGVEVVGSTNTLSGIISSTGGFTQSGAGTTILSGDDTYTGATSVTAGMLRLTGTLTASSVATSGTGILTESSGGLVAGSGATFTQGSTGTSTLSGANTYTGVTSVTAGTLSLPGSLNGSSVTTSGAGVLTETSAGLIGGSGATFTQGSTGLATLSGSNSFGGGTSVSGGTLQLGNTYALGTGSLTVNGGVLDLHGYSPTVAGLSGGSSGLIETLTSSPVTLTDNSSGSTTYAGVISDGSGQVALVQAGAGTLALTGINTYSGGTIINGTVQINTANSLGSTSGTPGGVTINNGGTLEVLGGNTISTNRTLSLSGTGTVQVDNGSNYTISASGGIATSAGTLNKSGSGTLTLAGNAANTGGANVNGGTLIVSGNLSGSVTVNSGATLGGASVGGYSGDATGGTIGGSVSVAQFGTIDPGAGQAFAGTVLSINSNLTMSGTSNFAVNLDAAGNSDYLVVGGALTLDPSNMNTDTLTLDVLGAVPSTAQTLTYAIAFYSSLSGHFGNIVLAGNGAILDSINYNDPNYQGDIPGYDAISVTLTVVPEPGTWAMLLGGFGILAFWRKPRRFRS